ncbi:MAG: hypothetical protein ACYC27_12570 [Armatimonadota bacterium]
MNDYKYRQENLIKRNIKIVKIKLILCIIALLGIIVLLAGCGGGGQAGVTLTVSTDTVVQYPIPSHDPNQDSPVYIPSPLPAGSSVVVYDFKTGNKITEGTIGVDGKTALDVTPGTSVVVITTGKLDDKDYRLSMIISSVPNTDTSFTLSPVTSITAEAIAQKYYKKGAVINQAIVNTVTEAVYAYTDRHLSGFSLTDGLIQGLEFGGAGSLNVGELQSVLDAVPDIISD